MATTGTQQTKTRSTAFEVVRWNGEARFEGVPVPASLRKVYVESHLVLIKEGVVMAIKRVWPIIGLLSVALGQLAGVAVTRALPSRPVVNPVTVSSTLLAAAGCVASLWRISKNGWQEVFDKVCRTDLSDGEATAHFGGQDGCCMMLIQRNATNSMTPPRIVGMACLTGATIANRIAVPELLPFAANEGLITRVGVLPEFHGQGGGAQLVRALLEEGEKRNLHRLALATTTVQGPAIKLYSRYGFQVVYRKAVFAIFGVFQYNMQVQLKPSS